MHLCLLQFSKLKKNANKTNNDTFNLSYIMLKNSQTYFKNLAVLAKRSLKILRCSETDLGLPAVNYYHKALHLRCCSSPRSASGVHIARFLKCGHFSALCMKSSKQLEFAN